MQELIARFPETHFARTLSRLDQLYRELDREIAAWQKAGNLHCPAGCGTCCETFEPHVEPAEADFCALYLCLKAPCLTGRITAFQQARHCIFFDAEGAGHCTIYPARPLLCRLFAFSSVRDKQNRTVFRLCAHMPNIGPARQFTGPDIPGTFTAYPPPMQEYSLQVQSLNPGSDSPPLPLSRSITSAIDKVRWLYHAIKN